MAVQVLAPDDRQGLAESVRAACERLLSDERLRTVAYATEDDGRGFDTELWQVLCAQVGVGAIALPEEHGGGYGAQALGVVAHELGRALAPVPLTPYVLATGLLADTASDELLTRVLPPLSTAERTAAAILTADAGVWTTEGVAFSASECSEGWRLTGIARHVWHGPAADDLVVVARIGDRLGLFLADTAENSVIVEPEQTLDATRPMGTVTLRQTRATRLDAPGRGSDVERAITRNVSRALAVLSAEQVGACERVLEIATDYARTRSQFGRAIGSFQAIKHKCADMLVDLEWSRSASQAALSACDDESATDTEWLASMAKAVCSQSLRSAAHANVQIHGGIGFTWESSAHLYVKRARTDEVVMGTQGEHWDRVASHTGIATGKISTATEENLDGVRAEIRAFLQHAPRPNGLRNYGPTPTPDDIGPGRQWHAHLAEHGYTCLHWPIEHGGADASVTFQAIFAEECARAGVPRQLGITAVDLVGPVIINYGSAGQKQRYLEPIRRGDHVWTQLFSEPGAGSDLAGVRTKAVRTDDGWRITGQKVWSSAANSAQFGLLLARTGSESHRGLSMFIVPMEAPDVRVRPLRQIDGECKFNEVFLDDVLLNDDAIIGAPGEGWSIALLTLGRERLTLGSQAVSMFRMHESMINAARERGRLDPVTQRAMTQLWVRMWLLRFTWQRAVADGDLTSPAFSVLKLMTSETDRDLGDMATDILGTDACVDPEHNDIVRAMLVGRAQTILGGTSEIQRNILGERILGLPKEPR